MSENIKVGRKALGDLIQSLEFNPETDESSLKTPKDKAIEAVTEMLSFAAGDDLGAGSASILNGLLDRLNSPELKSEDINSILEEAKGIAATRPDTAR